VNRQSTFADLEVYQVAREFRKAMYRLARQLPEIEKFGLVSQVRRAALSLTNNIAEGHGRSSLEELIDDLNACQDEKYVPTEKIASLKAKGWRVRQLIDGYIRYLRQQENASSTVQGTPPNYNDSAEFEDDSRFSM